MLAVFAVDGVYGVIEEAHLFGPEGVLEEGVLYLFIPLEMGKNYTRGAVGDPGAVKALKLFPEEGGYFWRIAGGMAEFYLGGLDFEILPFEERDNPSRGQPVPACLDAGRFQVSQ
jgi:hypothetical protein